MDEQPSMSLGDRIAWTGIVLVSILCVMRAMIEHDPFPWWSSDPFVFAPPIIGLTPRWALLLNLGIILASFLTLVGQHLRGFGVSKLNAILIAIGAIVLGYHASVDVERVLDSSTIAAVICVLVAGSQIHTIAGATKVIGGILLGFALMLTSIGVYEVFITHPETIKMYEQSRDSFLAARGWSPDSFEAMSYERRLSNPEPIAWFGLTNVFASFVAASGAGLITLAASSWKRDRTLSAISIGGAIVSTFGLYLCGSKGGYAVFVLGVSLGLIFVTRPKLTRGHVLIGLCLLVILGLIVRGVIGESLGERSLLFRYQYLIGALKVWMADPIHGIGPGMFQDGYALLKPALSPEDVASPHNVVFSWIATLGLGGVALVAHLVRSVGRSAAPRDDDLYESPALPAEQLIKASLLIVLVPAIVALRVQAPVLAQSGLITFFIGASLWIILAISIVRSELPEHMIRAVFFIFGGVLLIHSMIEVTGTMIVSAPIWALGIGVLVRTEQTSSRIGSLIVSACTIGMCVVFAMQWIPINRWERSLHASARDAQVLAEVHGSLNALEYASQPEILLDNASNSLGSLLGSPVGRSLDEIVNAMQQAEFLARQQAADDLVAALEARSTHTPTRIAISQQLLWIASVYQGIGQEPQSVVIWDQAIGLFEDEDLDAQGHRWLASILLGRASAFRDDPERTSWLTQAVRQSELAFALTPHDPHLAHQIMALHLELERGDDAQIWAQRAMDLHDQMRLDPIRGLSAGELEQARRILDGVE